MVVVVVVVVVVCGGGGACGDDMLCINCNTVESSLPPSGSDFDII